jgi:hypothetical protein
LRQHGCRRCHCFRKVSETMAFNVPAVYENRKITRFSYILPAPLSVFTCIIKN